MLLFLKDQSIFFSFILNKSDKFIRLLSFKLVLEVFSCRPPGGSSFTSCSPAGGRFSFWTLLEFLQFISDVYVKRWAGLHAGDSAVLVFVWRAEAAEEPTPSAHTGESNT